MREQLVAFLKCRTASRGVRYDGVEVAGREDSVDILLSEDARFVPNARMNVQRTATCLGGRNEHLAAVLLQHARGGFG